MSTKSWVIASPDGDTYEGIVFEEIPKIYSIMASTEFDEQFTQKGLARTRGELIPFPCVSHNSVLYLKLKRETIDVDISAWHNVPVNASFRSFIYTLGGIPWGEAVYIENENDVRITEDLEKFYETHGWHVKTYDQNQYQNMKQSPVRELNDVLLEEFFSLSNKKLMATIR